jgi:hypothetical protein
MIGWRFATVNPDGAMSDGVTLCGPRKFATKIAC